MINITATKFSSVRELKTSEGESIENRHRKQRRTFLTVLNNLLKCSRGKKGSILKTIVRGFNFHFISKPYLFYVHVYIGTKSDLHLNTTSCQFCTALTICLIYLFYTFYQNSVPSTICIVVSKFRF